MDPWAGDAVGGVAAHFAACDVVAARSYAVASVVARQAALVAAYYVHQSDEAVARSLDLVPDSHRDVFD